VNSPVGVLFRDGFFISGIEDAHKRERSTLGGNVSMPDGACGDDGGVRCGTAVRVRGVDGFRQRRPHSMADGSGIRYLSLVFRFGFLHFCSVAFW